MTDETKAPRVRSIGDLADHLGLSRWTVSRILNGHKGVHEETRKRVLEEMDRLNFRPNMMARGLRGAKTGLIGVCIQEIESPILVRKIAHLQDALRARGLRGILEITSNSADAERDIIEHFVSLRVDGIALLGSRLDPDDPVFARLADSAIPAVAVDPANLVPLPRVELDRHLAMSLCLKHLCQIGHKSFGLLGVESDPVYGARRVSGLRQAAERQGIDYDGSFRSLTLPGRADWSYGYGFDLAQELLQSESPPRALIALNDRVAIGAIKAIREWGYQVPKDFAMVGFDNLDIGVWTDPPLTTVGQNEETLIELAIKRIQGLVANFESGAKAQQCVVVQPKLIVRGST